MTDKELKEKILAEIERLRKKNEVFDDQYELAQYELDVSCGYDSALEDILSFINSLPEEQVNENLEEASMSYAQDVIRKGEETLRKQYKERYGLDFGEAIVSTDLDKEIANHFKAGAKWQKANLWKPAEGDDLTEIDREVVALLNNGKIVFAHRPNPDGWDGKSIATGKVEHYIPKTYGKGGWNIPDVKWWLDVELPKEIEL